MSEYRIALEVAGPTAMWTRPDSGDAPTSYPAPTRSAAKGLFESVLWLRSAEVVPVKVEICAPLIFHGYTTNYGGPLRKTGTVNYQLIATVLINVCYRLYAEVRPHSGPAGRLSRRAQAWAGSNGPHAYQEMFHRRIVRGQFFRTPCLGWQEFIPDYLGGFRHSTRVQEDLNISIPSMLDSVFPRQGVPALSPRFKQNLTVVKGTLDYAT
jgi:CRISPR-associated protein Cas5d